MPEAARKTDLTSHAGAMAPGPCSPNVNIGDQPSWRAVPSGVGGGIEAASKAVKQLIDQPMLDPAMLPAELIKINVQLMQSAGAAASQGSPGAPGEVTAGYSKLMATTVQQTATYASAAAVPGGEPAARLAFTTAMKMEMGTFASDAIGAIAGMTDIHNCPMPGVPPHGAGTITKGSTSVFINDLPATRKGDELFEGGGGADPISMGCPTVFMDDAAGSGASSSAASTVSVAEALQESYVQSSEAAMVTAAQSGMPLIEVCPYTCPDFSTAAEEPRTTFAVRIVDDASGQPLMGVELVVTLADGVEETHRTDTRGEIHIDDARTPGVCSIRCEMEGATRLNTADFIRRE